MKKRLSLIAAAAVCTTSLSAMQFQTIGYKSVAMGGACVANSLGSNASYDNPALLAKPTNKVEISLGVGVSTYDHGIGASVKELDDSGFIDTIDSAQNNVSSLSSSDINTLFEGRDIVIDMNGNAVELAPHAYFATQISNFGIGVFGSSDVTATAVVSQAHNKLIFEDTNYGTGYAEVLDNGSVTASNLATYQNSSIEYAINNNLTYLDIKAVGIAEVPVAYGHKFDIPGGALMVGGALKYIKAFTYMEKVNIDDSDDATDDKNDDTDSSFGVDLGLAYEPSYVKDLTLALVAKNLNKPEFSFVDGSDIEIEPMVRAGVAYNIFESLEIAADIDLTKNETLIPDVKSQMVGGGLSYHPASWFAIRGGLMKNLDSSDKADVIYTAGLGIGLKWFQVDLSAQMSSNDTTVGGTDYPEYAKVNLAIISRW